ncbi:MAG: glycosyltransferase family 2 protein [Lachnospiraceae bacterium]|nr:glycosyltransferase family 2 protein [Lachnospiraceae bacterium]
MITVSLCMIVKNEEKVLDRCLSSMADLMDEIIIVDTGSTDRTKEIASKYTDRIYDFEWVDDFSAPRNYAFELCGSDYIYTADADEYFDEENRFKFKVLKEGLDPEVEIVQMYYGNQLENGSVYNYDKELRPKLFKKYREFRWIERVHETVRESPVVYNSDIVIIHKPERPHALRDFRIFKKMTDDGEVLSQRSLEFYAKELFIAGREEDFLAAESYFTKVADTDETKLDDMRTAICVIVKAALIRKDYLKMYKYAIKDVVSEPCSEICFLLGSYYDDIGDYKEAAVWYFNAGFETHAILDIRYEKELPVKRLSGIYKTLGLKDVAAEYDRILQDRIAKDRT